MKNAHFFMICQIFIQGSKLQGDIHRDSAPFLGVPGTSRISLVMPMAQVHCRKRTGRGRIKVSGSIFRNMKNSESQLLYFCRI